MGTKTASKAQSRDIQGKRQMVTQAAKIEKTTAFNMFHKVKHALKR